MSSKEIPTCKLLIINIIKADLVGALQFYEACFSEQLSEEHDGAWKILLIGKCGETSNMQYLMGDSQRAYQETPPEFLKLCLHITNKYATYKNNRATANLDELL